VGGKWRFRHKLMLGLGLVVAIMGLLLAGTLKGLASYRATMRAIDSRLEELQECDKIRSTVKFLAPRGDLQDPLAGIKDRLAEARAALRGYHAKLQETIDTGRNPDNSFKEMEQAKALEQGFKRLDVAVERAFGPADHATRVLLNQKVKLAIDNLVQTSNDLHNVIYNDLFDRIRKSKADYKLSFGIVLGTAIVGVLLLLSLLRFFYRWIFYPIRDLQQGVDRVGKGNFEYRIDVRSGDEIEDLAEAFNDMSSRLREMYRDLARQVNERSRQLVRSERLAGVGFLAAGVAHEINNPLAGIAFCSEALETRFQELLNGMAGLGRKGADCASQDREIVAKYLKMIQDEAFRCKKITERLLEFSRGGDRHREPTDIGKLIQGVLDIVQLMPNCKGKELILLPSAPVEAWVNSQEVQSVVLNLVVNALDSMDESGKLTIGLRQRDGMAEMTFQDTGCGMTEEVLENIFEPFFTRSRTGKGTGLGLSISHRIINQHGGDIEAASAGPNQGSTFTVRIPLQPVEVAAEPEVECETAALRKAA